MRKRYRIPKSVCCLGVALFCFDVYLLRIMPIYAHRFHRVLDFAAFLRALYVVSIYLHRAIGIYGK